MKEKNKKNKILFIANGPLKDPLKGTPIRIYNFLYQISKDHDLTVCADNMNDIVGVDFKLFPRGSKVRGFLYFIKLIKDKKIDVVFITSELLLPLVVVLKLLTNVKIAIDLHGLYFEEWYYHKRISFFSKIIKEIKTRFFLLFFDLIFVVSGKLKKYYRYNNKNIKVIYGGVDLKIFPISQIKNSEKIIIGYMGNPRSYQGLDNLLWVAQQIKTKKIFDFKLNLIISGNQEDFYKMLDFYGLRDDSLINFNVKHDLVGGIMSKSDVLVIPRPSLKMTEYAFPSKLTEYLATGIVTIVTNVGPVDELFVDNDHCLVVDHLNIRESLRDALIKANSIGEKRRMEIGQRGRDFVGDNLTWDVLGKKINDSFSKL